MVMAALGPWSSSHCLTCDLASVRTVEPAGGVVESAGVGVESARCCGVMA